MRLKDILAAAKGRLTHAELHLYLGFCQFADNRTGECYPEVATVADAVGMLRPAASRALKILLSTGFLKRDGRRFSCVVGYAENEHVVNSNEHVVNSDDEHVVNCDEHVVNPSEHVVNCDEHVVNSLNKDRTNQLTNQGTNQRTPAASEQFSTANDFDPVGLMVDAFPDVMFTVAQLEHFRTAVKPEDAEAWKATVEKYRLNHDPMLRRYVPTKVANVLSVFKAEQEAVEKRRRQAASAAPQINWYKPQGEVKPIEFKFNFTPEIEAQYRREREEREAREREFRAKVEAELADVF